MEEPERYVGKEENKRHWEDGLAWEMVIITQELAITGALASFALEFQIRYRALQENSRPGEVTKAFTLMQVSNQEDMALSI